MEVLGVELKGVELAGGADLSGMELAGTWSSVARRRRHRMELGDGTQRARWGAATM